MSSIKELRKRKTLSLAGGGEERLLRQKESGKMLARDRIEAILDPNTFQEIGQLVLNQREELPFYGDGVITGTGKINGRSVCIYSQDFTVSGGSLASAHAEKIIKIMELAERTKSPIIGINDSGGARIQEGVESLAGYAEIFHRNVKLSGVVPQISLILGPCAGGAVYSPALTDFIFVVEKISHMFVTGPDVLKTVTNEEVSKETLGGAITHASKSGVAHFHCRSEAECFSTLRKLFEFLPDKEQKIAAKHAPLESLPELDEIIPKESNQAYDMKNIIRTLADNNEFFEVQADYGRNIITGFIKLAGKITAVIANQPKWLAGCLDINASSKAARFVRFADAFNIQILTLVDVPGFLPGVNQEHGGIIRHGAKLLYAFSEATVPRITLITRKAYGGAYDVMNSKHIGADFNYAWPSAQIAVMGGEGAIKVLYRKELKDLSPLEQEEKVAKLLEDYRDKYESPWKAAELGYLDAVIEPSESRKTLINSFELLKSKQTVRVNRKHGNIPL